MKKLYKIDQYLLERYPTIWNTKIVWVLLLSLIIHVLFFVFGWFSHSNPESLQYSNALWSYFTNGMFFVQAIISVLILVIWLVMMLKNNAFKNFYPTNKWKLFSQFVQYFIIIMVSVSFFYSYLLGLKLYVKSHYDDDMMKSKIERINKAAPFLTQYMRDYTLDNRLQPKVFSELYCERTFDDILLHEKYYNFYNDYYQFYTLFSITVYKKDSYGNFIEPRDNETSGRILANFDEKDSHGIFYYKDEVVDLDSLIKTTNPSYTNFSNVFYFQNLNVLTRNNKYFSTDFDNDDDSDSLHTSKMLEINAFTQNILKRNDRGELEKVLDDFLKISQEFKIKTNLNTKGWLKMINTKAPYEVNHFIRSYKPIEFNDPYQYSELDAIEAVDAAATKVFEVAEATMDSELREKEHEYYEDRLTDYYYSEKELKTFLTNIDEIKYEDVFSESIHILFWLAFGLSCLIFTFRITGLRSLLFSFVTFGILCLIILLVVFFTHSLYENVYRLAELLTFYFSLIMGTIILLLSILGLNKTKKPILGVLINIVICGFPAYVLLYFIIISLHQDIDGARNIDGTLQTNIIKTLDLNLSYIILIISLVFMYFYTGVLHKWKSLSN